MAVICARRVVLPLCSYWHYRADAGSGVLGSAAGRSESVRAAHGEPSERQPPRFLGAGRQPVLSISRRWWPSPSRSWSSARSRRSCPASRRWSCCTSSRSSSRRRAGARPGDHGGAGVGARPRLSSSSSRSAACTIARADEALGLVLLLFTALVTSQLADDGPARRRARPRGRGRAPLGRAEDGAAAGGLARSADAAGLDQGERLRACASPAPPTPTRTAPSCWRRSRRRPTGSTGWSPTCSTPRGSRPAR